MAKTRHNDTSPTPMKKKAKEKEVVHQDINNSGSVAPIQHICRTCLEEIQASSLIPLNDSSSNIRNELRACIPELDCDLIPDSVICTNCLNALHEAYQFKQKCLQTEDKIRQQVHKKNLIDLNKLKRSNNVIVTSENGLDLDVVYISETQPNMIWNCESPKKETSQDLTSIASTKSIGEAGEPVSSNLAIAVTNNDTETIDDDSLNSNTCRKVEYLCKHCDYKCDILQPFILHLKTHPYQNYSCPGCDYQTKYARVLSRHITSKCANKDFGQKVPLSPVEDHLCASCGYITQNEIDYEKHTQTCKDQMDVVDTSYCSYSSSKSVSPASLYDNNDNNNKTESQCALDNVITNCLTEEINQIPPFFIKRRRLMVDLSKSKIPEAVLQNPVKREDSNGVLNSVTSNETTDNDSESSDGLNFFCIHCNFSCVGMKPYHIHMKEHGGSRYVCPCNFGTRRWQNFIMHVKRSCMLYKDLTPNTSDSDRNVKRNRTKSSTISESHKLNSSSISPMEVSSSYDVSDESNNSTNTNIEHIENNFNKINKPVEPKISEQLDCSGCNYKTFSTIEFEIHNKKYHGIPRPYVCKDRDCHFAAKIRTNLSAHMKSHGGNKPYCCAKCTYGTIRRGVLARHLLGHNIKKQQ